ncbi:hypothetical protein [Nannocystis radixulma]|uniref:Uncharacterized protein n=1 Tax=Nannocystis radixulma TaxID=2995305 RepID=A0ABT5BFF9_9BACT|nr:hypothetical protein [Nannocystis radixulma]MDC0672453.1 hypothetical protein [Nannocystis radixulma]
MPTYISPDDLARLYPEDLDLYDVWNWDASVSENVGEIIRGFPWLADWRHTLEGLADKALRGETEPFGGEFYLRSGSEDEMTEAATRARALGVAHVIRRTGSGEPWEP